jgi:hypothetical protein
MRTAKDVIDDAIFENKPAEWLMYIMSLGFSSIGMYAIYLGLNNGSFETIGIGGICSLVVWPAMGAARRTRKENIAIRLLEAPLSRVDTSKEAAEMLHKLVDNIMRDQRKDG